VSSSLYQDVLPLHRAISKGVNQSWTETSEIVSQHKPPLFIS
jgi:hypothetical protein